ncbi:MAG: hypothetical protein IK081_16960 [Lachnospiraceae bacterium]|nr:hypothetical protein [Lachnospiraceae bacterium]
MKKYVKLMALAMAVAMIFTTCSCSKEASLPKATIVKSVDNEFEFPLFDKSDEEIVEYLYRVTTGFHVGMSTEQWKDLVGIIPEFYLDDVSSISYGYGAPLGTWPLKDNVEMIALYGYDNVDEKMQEVETSEDIDRELIINIVIADWDRAERIYDLLVEKYKKMNLGDQFNVWDENDQKQTSCVGYWSVFFYRDTDSRRYENKDGGAWFSVIIESEFINR